MRYAFFIDKLKNGGAERVTTILANYFARENEVYLFVVDDSQVDYVIDDSITIIRVPFSSSKVKRMLNRRNYVVKKISEIGLDACITLTYTFLPYILSAPRRKRGKVIASLRNAPQFEIQGIFGRFLRWVGFSLCDNIVFQTPDARDYFSKNIQKKGVVIPNPISENLPFAKDERDKTIVMATRLEKQKNIPLAIDAFREFHKTHKDWTLEIYGRGCLQQELEDCAKRDVATNGAIHFHGFASNIHDVMAHCGMLLLSSDFEGLSNSMIEAMAIGAPVVCTDCPIGGARMMIRSGENGFLVPLGDKDAMVEAITHIAEEPDTARMIGKNATGIREQLAADYICAQWESLITFREVLD